MDRAGTQVQIEYREDYGMGGNFEPVWRAVFDGARWSIRFVRHMNYGAGDTNGCPSGIEPELPGFQLTGLFAATAGGIR